jgi:phage head maturation protease
MSQTLQQIDNEPFFTEGTVEFRSVEGGKQYFYGYAALFNVRSRTLTTKKGVKFVEQILLGAFDSTDFSDLRSHFDHQDFLATEPTLQYGVDERGLWYQVEYDAEDPVHRSAMRRIVRLDAKGSSFQFAPLSPECYILTKDGEMPLRSIKKIPRVVELGPVITPAYSPTTAFARSLD